MSEQTIRYSDWQWTIGDVVAIFGLRGEMKVRFQTDFPERFQSLRRVCLRKPDGAAEMFKVSGCRFHKGCALLKIDGIDDATAAELWRGALVQVRRADAMPLDDDSYYVTDLKGVMVETVQGRVLGPVDDVLQYPAQDLLRIGDALVPMVRGIVLEVDMAARRIVIDPPEGMLPGDDQPDAD